MLAEATRSERVWPVLVADPELLAGLAAAPGRLAWYAASVRALDAELRALGSGLVVLSGPPERVLPAFASRVGAERVVASASDEPSAAPRDRRVADQIPVTLVEDLRLFAPGELLTSSGRVPRRFAPFRRLLSERLDTEPWRIAAETSDLARLAPMERGGDRYPDATAAPAIPLPGAPEARSMLERFTAEALPGYAADRNRPDLDATSRLSPYLRVGAISIRALWRAATEAGGGPGASAWRTELTWREYFHHLLAGGAADEASGGQRRVPWDEGDAADAALLAWETGRTGYPIVDAGMRQLAATGWMHNRVRLITASFLVKDLGIDPIRGAAAFHDHLIDGDVAQNTGNWEWVAGTGADAAPYFRILNPTLQGRRFDPRGTFVRRWLPELASVPDAWIHEPWLAPATQRARDYPSPIVDHAAARLRTMARFARTATGRADRG
jgi:deoxyribodipyrimidine photo-lyase